MFNLELIQGNLSEDWTIANNGHSIMVSTPKSVKWQLRGIVLDRKYHFDNF